MIAGTLIVLVLYVLLNFTFLYTAPIDAMTGRLEIGYVSAQYVFGATGASIMGVALAALLVSTVSAMVLAGPRVLHVIGQDFPAFAWLARTNKNAVPHFAIYLQSTIALVFIWSASFESILVFAGFTLGLNTFFTVLGLFILRFRRPELPRPYKVAFYPLPPLILLGITGWTLIYILLERPNEGWMGLGVVISGGAFYALTVWLGKNRDV